MATEVPPEHAALAWLRANLPDVRWRIPKRTRSGLGVDLVGRTAEGEQVVVAIKQLRGANRLDRLQGAAAMALLELQRHGDASRLAWLCIDQLGTQVIDKLEAYLDEVAPEANWVVVDRQGGARAHVPEFGLDLDVEPELPVSSARGHATKLFGDLNAWMLKTLLMQHAPAWAWTAARGPWRTPRSLATGAGVSDATAHRFVKVMSEADYLRQDRRGLHLVRVESLLQQWRASHRALHSPMLEVRPLFDLDPKQWGTSVLGKSLALGGEFAAKRFGLAHATRLWRSVWVDADPQQMLDALELVPAEPGQGLLRVGRPRHVQSCFRGRIIVDEQAFIDPCELMLESAMVPTRGAEQSDYLLERILAWQNGSSDGK